MSRPRFVVLEGVEGAGKSTQIRRLSTWLDELGVDHLAAREPGGTEVGEAIREVLLTPRETDVTAETELLLMLAARATFVREVVEPALSAGRVVLADRFDFSTFAYQGHGRGLDLEAVRRLNAFATGGLRPDLTVVLDLSVDEGAARQARQGGVPDRIEGAGRAFLERVGEGYRTLAAADDRACIVDARADADTVHRRLRALLGSTFPETFPVRAGS